MALTTIEYGSIASSATLNNNFSYLNNKVDDSNTQINSSISSIMSNITTINTRITELSESISSSLSNLSSALADYKTKTKLLVKNSGMVPNWAACRSISFTSGTDYTATLNGYVLILPATSAAGNLTVNEKTVALKLREDNNDNASLLVSVPVQAGDVLSTTVNCASAYFVPAAEISVSNF